MEQIVLWVGGLLLLSLVLKTAKSLLFIKNKNRHSSYNYKKSDCVMTDAERKFFAVLLEAVGNKYYVFPQVHLSTILEHKIVGQNWHGALRHIDEKSVDFVLCENISLKPILAIELDDRSHLREDRIQRDAEVERILNEADLPFIRFENHGNFNVEEIRNRIHFVLN